MSCWRKRTVVWFVEFQPWKLVVMVSLASRLLQHWSFSIQKFVTGDAAERDDSDDKGIL
jgi:hypothetical protein